MKSKPNIRTLVVTACVLLFASALLVFSQTPSPSVSPSPTMQMQDTNQTPSMMPDSMTKMSEMCMTIMQQEKAARNIGQPPSPIKNIAAFFNDCEDP